MNMALLGHRKILWLFKSDNSICHVLCRQAKLNTTERIIEDIDQSDGLQNYYSINSQPDQKTVNSSNIISRIIEKITK